MDDLAALWANIDGETLSGTWTTGSALVPTEDAPDAMARAPLPPLDLAADFELGEVIGRGGNGVVLAARQKSLDREVAIKVLNDAAEQHAAAALLAEARSAGGLEHPNIVPIHALGIDPQGRPVLVMKRLSGVSWAEVLADAAHAPAALPSEPLERQLHIVDQLIAAVECAHAAGVVHRDIKPANVMIGDAGEICLVDWGLACRIGEQTRGPAGTPGYMPPEMFVPQTVADARTDVYLVAASLFAALVGQAPNTGITLLDVLRGTLEPVNLPTDLPDELRMVLHRALQQEPDARHPSIGALRSALRAFAAHREANRLCDAAEGQLADIRADNPERAMAFGAARFGFDAALNRWPDSPRARAGMSAVHIAMARAEIETGQFDAAESALGTLPVPPSELVDLLQARRLAADVERSQIEKLRDERDTVRGLRGRRLLLPFMIVAGILGPMVTGILRLSGRIDPVGFPIKRAVLPLLISLGLLGWLRWTRRPTLRQAFNQRSLSILAFLILAVAASFVIGDWLGLSVPQVVTYNLLLLALSEAMIARLIATEFAWPALSSGLFALGAARYPAYAELFLGAANCVAAAILWTVWRRRARTEQA